MAKIIKACGIIIWQKNKKKFLLIQHQAGHWGFPKGHQENKEDDLATALREVKEETGLTKINIISQFKISEFYQINHKNKEVIYFLGQTTESQIKIQLKEIKNFAWLEQEQILRKLTFEGSKKVFLKTLIFLNKIN